MSRDEPPSSRPVNMWRPAPGETLLSRAPVTFASGAAMRVRGMRWFRDTERNDIQHELPGWPDGPTYTAHSAGGAFGLKSLVVGAKFLGVAVLVLLSALGGNLSGPDDASGSKTPDEPENEIDDFPVIWAAPGTIARTLPWQLDPARADQKRHSTHLIVTDRRLIIVRTPYDKHNHKAIDDEKLWECPRTDIRNIELKDFRDGEDFKITFTDSSWCRLTCTARRKLTRYLVQDSVPLPLDSLSPEQRRTVLDFVRREKAPESVSPVVTVNPCGHYRVEIFLPHRFTSLFGASEESMVMNPDGRKAEAEEYHPEDL